MFKSILNKKKTNILYTKTEKNGLANTDTSMIILFVILKKWERGREKNQEKRKKMFCYQIKMDIYGKSLQFKCVIIRSKSLFHDS